MLKDNGFSKPNKKSHEEVKCPYCKKKFKLTEDNSEFITKTEKILYCDFCGEEFSSAMSK